MKKSKTDKRNKTSKFDIRVNYFECIKDSLEKREYVDGEILSRALRNSPRTSDLDPVVLSYLCEFLEGKIEKPKGRRPVDENYLNRRNMVMRYFYARYLKWIRIRRERYGDLKGWSMLQDADFWIGPPNERAARMVARRFSYGAKSYRTVQNIISSQK